MWSVRSLPLRWIARSARTCPDFPGLTASGGIRRQPWSSRGDGDRGGPGEPQTVPPPFNTTKEYISKNPELQKLLSDLYEDYEPEKDDKKGREERKEDKEDEHIVDSLSERYSEFRDSDGQVILDVDEERQLRQRLVEQGVIEPWEELGGAAAKGRESRQVEEDIELEVGERGVFEVEELVSLLRKENCRDLVTLRVDPERSYVDYLVVVTCRSPRHMVGLAEYVNKVYKRKGSIKGPGGLHFEGKKSPNDGWIAVDMGNIALHLFTHGTRRHYDIESLWALGPEHDELSRRRDPIEELFPSDGEVRGEKDDLLSDLKPLS